MIYCSMFLEMSLSEIELEKISLHHINNKFRSKKQCKNKKEKTKDTHCLLRNLFHFDTFSQQITAHYRPVVSGVEPLMPIA